MKIETKYDVDDKVWKVEKSYSENKYYAKSSTIWMLKINVYKKGKTEIGYELPYYYPDFLEYLKNCKYKSCTHTNEKDCGIKQAVQNGKIDVARYERYQVIYNNLKSKKL